MIGRATLMLLVLCAVGVGWIGLNQTPVRHTAVPKLSTVADHQPSAGLSPEASVTTSSVEPLVMAPAKRKTQQAARSAQPERRKHFISQEDSRQVCMTTPAFNAVERSVNGELSGFMQFDIAAALKFYNRQRASTMDSMQAFSLSLQMPANGGAGLDLNFSGESVVIDAHPGQQLTVLFPGHLLRSHSQALLVVRDRDGELWPDLKRVGNWRLCGVAVDDPRYDWLEPVNHSGAGFNIGPGVNVMGSEYACAQGWGLHHHVARGVSHQELAAMLAAWRVQTVRLPVNEHCWLADEIPANYLKPEYTGEAYRHSVSDLIALLTSQRYRMKVVLDLHWTGTLEQKALKLQPLPDRQFAARFWRSAASRYRDNPHVIFNIFNEPHVPKNSNYGRAVYEKVLSIDSSGERAIGSMRAEQLALSKRNNWWLTWRDGDNQYAGMQALVDAVRGTGAKNIISVGGLDFSGDLRGWVSYAPHDPLGKLWADNHAYPAGGKCANDACWAATLLPIKALGYGVMFGETGNSIGAYPQGCDADFVKKVYRFSRRYNIPALPWTFIPGGVSEASWNQPLDNNCKIPSLITRWPGERDDGNDLLGPDVRPKKLHDPTPDNWADDATWAGCVALAYLHGLDLSDDSVANKDPQLQGMGNCSAVFPELLIP